MILEGHCIAPDQSWQQRTVAMKVMLIFYRQFQVCSLLCFALIQVLTTEVISSHRTNLILPIFIRKKTIQRDMTQMCAWF